MDGHHPPQVVGFHYYSIVVDGAVMADPETRTFFGSGWDNSGIEIPEPENVAPVSEQFRSTALQIGADGEQNSSHGGWIINGF